MDKTTILQGLKEGWLYTRPMGKVMIDGEGVVTRGQLTSAGLASYVGGVSTMVLASLILNKTAFGGQIKDKLTKILKRKKSEEEIQ